MLSFRRTTEAGVDDQIRSFTGRRLASPRFLTLEKRLEPRDVSPFSYDRSKSCLGRGEAVFAAAKRAFVGWQMFDLGWVRVVNTAAPIAVNQVVAVEVHSLGLWSVNLSRILEAVDSKTRFGFLYSTTAHHVEQGEETFLLRFEPETGEVSYELEAISRPRHVLAKAGYAVTRYFQHRFARDSHRRLHQAVTLNS